MPLDVSAAVPSVDPNAVVLIALALTLFIADIKLTTHGVLSAAGMIALVIGAALLIQAGTVGYGGGPWLVWLAVLATGVLLVIWVRKAAEARRQPPFPGLGSMAGRPGVARSDLSPAGTVFVNGALWDGIARDGRPILAGRPIAVVGQRGLLLEVEPVAPAAAGVVEA